MKGSRHKLLVILFTLLSCVLCGQTTVLGKVIGEQDKLLSSVYIVLVSLPDSISVSITKTDSFGQFKIRDVAGGMYIIKASGIGVKPATGTSFYINGVHQQVSLQDISTQTDDKYPGRNRLL